MYVGLTLDYHVQRDGLGNWIKDPENSFLIEQKSIAYDENGGIGEMRVLEGNILSNEEVFDIASFVGFT